MKLTRKLTLALILGILVVLVVNAALRVRREIALFERDSGATVFSSGGCWRVP